MIRNASGLAAVGYECIMVLTHAGTNLWYKGEH